MMPLCVAFFNLIFNSGVFPACWLEMVIRPIYKNNGDSKSLDNYRPITILSCFGKLLTYILNLRLYKFLDAHNILGEISLVSAQATQKWIVCFVLHVFCCTCIHMYLYMFSHVY